MGSILLVAVLVAAVIFEFINGFHDTANAIATTVYTKALPLRVAILMSATMNFIGALMSEKVAMTIASKFVFACFDWEPYWCNHRIYRNYQSHYVGRCSEEGRYPTVYFSAYWHGFGLFHHEAGL